MQVLLFRGELVLKKYDKLSGEYEVILRYKNKDILCIRYTSFKILDVCIIDPQAIEMHIKECLYEDPNAPFAECKEYKVAIFIYEDGHLFDDEFLIAAILVE